jgi:ArsR family transcriptional regulator, lead/cadmium/zinc/bismuth-responsive transcriptional repressor
MTDPVTQDRPAPGTRSSRRAGLLTADHAEELAGTFKVLANDTRLLLLQALVGAGELCVTDLASEIGMTSQAISNQLQRLADRRILATRRDGNRIFYRIIDPCVPALLDLGLCLTKDAGAGGRMQAAAV